MALKKLLKFIPYFFIAIFCVISGCSSDKSQAIIFSNKAPDFMKDRSKVSLIGSCNMENIDGKGWSSNLVIPSNYKEIRIGGWLYDQKNNVVPEEIYILLVDKNSRKEFYALAAKDNRIVTIDGRNLPAGYKATVDASELPGGEYEALVVASSMNNPILCANGRFLQR
jgi:hypothetical protein